VIEQQHHERGGEDGEHQRLQQPTVGPSHPARHAGNGLLEERRLKVQVPPLFVGNTP